MDGTAFAYAGLTGNALIGQPGTDVSRRLLAFSGMVRLVGRETGRAPGEAARHVHFTAGVAAACGTDGDGASFEQRLARWLLLARMRLGSDTIPVTHWSLSHVLGVHRTGVTGRRRVAGAGGMVGRGRGFVRVEEAAALGAVWCGCYGLLSDEYGRFINNLDAI